jgi:ABC-2 type transport system ATP-binding protein
MIYHTNGSEASPEPGLVAETASPDREPVISVRGLAKRYGAIQAVAGVDFDVFRGETFGFLGPNGAGKTTTINMLCTLATPTAGSATVAGFDVVRERDDVRRSIGVVFQDTTLDSYLTAERNLRFHAELYGVSKGVLESRLRQVLDIVGLWDRKDSKVLE